MLFCVFLYTHMHEYVYRSQVTVRCVSLISVTLHCIFYDPEACLLDKTSWPASPRESTSPAPGLTGQCSHTQLFMWVLRIPIQVIMCAQQALYQLSHLSSPRLLTLMLGLISANQFLYKQFLHKLFYALKSKTLICNFEKEAYQT